MRSFVDTNVLVYRVDGAEPAKRRVAARVLEEARPGTLAISTQVLAEFYVTTTRKLARPLSASDARKAVEYLCLLPVVPADAALIQAGIALSQRYQLSLWDALIVQAALVAQCQRILSEDLQDGAVIESVVIENPFRALPPGDTGEVP